MPQVEYAKAFYSIASEDDLSNFNTFTNCLEEEFVSLIESKKITKKQKFEIIDNIINHKELLGDFLKVLIENNRFNLCKEINEELTVLRNKRNNVTVVTVYSKTEIADKEIQHMTNSLVKHLNRNVTLKVVLDDSLIGGIKIKYDGKTLDNSILSRFNELKNELTR